MAIQKVSDLSVLDISYPFGSSYTPNSRNNFDEEKMSKVRNSLLEISFPEETVASRSSGNIEYTKFRSMAIELDTLSSYIINDIIYGDITYYGLNTFDQTLYLNNGCEISGNFFLNKDNDAAVRSNGYRAYIETVNNTLLALAGNGTSEDEGWNILSGERGNSLNGPITQIQSFDGNDTYATFSSNRIDLDKYTVVSELSCGDLSVKNNLSGNAAYFNDLTCIKKIHGCALCACWADVAEIYSADDDYPPGMLVQFGGEKEITIASDNANAVVTKAPGLVLNSDFGAEHPVGIALAGRTPVLAYGQVRKFDRLYLHPMIHGVAYVPDHPCEGEPIGLALGDKNDDGMGFVECSVRFNL